MGTQDQDVHLDGDTKSLHSTISGQLCLTLQHCFCEGETSADVTSPCISICIYKDETLKAINNIFQYLSFFL